MKRTGKRIVILLAVMLLSGCAGGNGLNSPASTPMPTLAGVGQPATTTLGVEPVHSFDPQNAGEVTMYDTQYGFVFLLPESWQGYTVVESTWEGTAISGVQAGKIVESGPELLIRHPQWSTETPRQDIPIMIFLRTQWEALGNEVFHIGAAPIGPTELGRNSRYVFALPARYNFAYLFGYEEVEGILNGQPLKPIEPLIPKG